MVEAIPGGQIVGIMAAMGYWFNAIVVSTVIPAIKTNAVFLSDGLKMVQNAKQQVVDQYGPRLLDAQEKVTAAVEKARGKANEMMSQARSAQNVANVAANPSIGNTTALVRDSQDRKAPIKGGYSVYGGSKKKKKNAARTMRRLKRTLNRFQKPNNSRTRKARRHRTTRKK